jgi:hypothetical protein
MTESGGSTIEAIYVFDDSGICVISMHAPTHQQDSDLMTGFFSAMKLFGKSQLNSDIEHILFSGRKLYYQSHDHLTFVVQGSRGLQDPLAKHVLDTSAAKFLTDFGDLLPGCADFACELPGIDQYTRFLMQFFDEEHLEKIVDSFQDTKKSVEVVLFEGEMKKAKKEHRGILELCDGTRTVQEIASQLNLPYFQVLQTIVAYPHKRTTTVRMDS